MSASPIARQACSHAQVIPSKRVLVTDASQLPDLYSSTPGGTLYSTTPGGTRIIYERAFLMILKNSPLSQTPPNTNLPSALLRNGNNNHSNNHHHNHSHLTTTKHFAPRRSSHSSPVVSKPAEHEEQFEIDL